MIKPKTKGPRLLYFLQRTGFGSELNVFLYAIIYANNKGYHFTPASLFWNCKIEKGWNDYFTSFKEQGSHLSLRIFILKTLFKLPRAPYLYNYNPHNKKTVSHKNFLKSKIYTSKQALVNTLSLTLKKTVKIVTGKNIVLVMEEYRKNILDFACLELKTNYDAFLNKLNKILSHVWQINPEINQLINNKTSIKKEYVTFHIRRGDKIVDFEDRLYDVQEYINVFLNLRSQIKTIFLMSDDYRVYTELKKKLPNYHILTLLDSNKRGHMQRVFNTLLSTKNKKNEIINLLTEIEIARNSAFFIGSQKSNLYRLLTYFKLKNCYDVSGNNKIALDSAP